MGRARIFISSFPRHLRAWCPPNWAGAELLLIIVLGPGSHPIGRARITDSLFVFLGLGICPTGRARIDFSIRFPFGLRLRYPSDGAGADFLFGICHVRGILAVGIHPTGRVRNGPRAAVRTAPSAWMLPGGSGGTRGHNSIAQHSMAKPRPHNHGTVWQGIVWHRHSLTWNSWALWGPSSLFQVVLSPPPRRQGSCPWLLPSGPLVVAQGDRPPGDGGFVTGFTRSPCERGQGRRRG